MKKELPFTSFNRFLQKVKSFGKVLSAVPPHNYLLFCMLCLSVLFSKTLAAQNITIIESQSYNPGHVMDIVWQSTASSAGMNAVIAPQSTLLDTNFFANTDALIVSSGVIILTNTQINTLIQFMKSGRSLYLQGEYDCAAYNTNTTFESMVNGYGGNFTLNGTISGTLAPMEVLGALATTPNTVSPLSYFWYGCNGTACSNVEPFLKYNNDYFGFIFCPPIGDYGKVVFTSDQDWVNQSTSLPLMKNILDLITTNSWQCSGTNFFSIELGADTTICSDSTYVLSGGPSAFSHIWSTGATGPSITVDTAGTYWVTISNGSCSVSDTIVITEVPCNTSPVLFSAAQTKLCEKFCADFFDNSVNNPTAWHWTFEGGSPSTSVLQHPANICYSVPGNYDVTLITTSAGGNDTLTLENYMTVHPTPPFPSITQDGNLLTSSAASFYQWQFNAIDIPGATNQSYLMTQSGLHTVVVADSNSCENSTTENFIISGIGDELTDFTAAIYPNPSGGKFMVEISGAVNVQEVNVEVVNVLGQVMFQQAASFHGNSITISVEIENSTPGIYFAEIKAGNKILQEKLLIIN
ncbi:MAG TPA: T9SS type A sorting domain-containing protein [Chitinophagales bacterium]|nr:T9SS type A sorting domain-containing protein [Chitinophagales bacterium]